MTETFLEDYFKSLAVRSVFIAHTDSVPSFFRVQSKSDPDEFDNAVRSVKKNICLLLELGSGEMELTDNPRDYCRIGLHVLVKTTEKSSDIKAGRDQAKAVLRSLISKIRRDVLPRYEYSDSEAGVLNQQNVVLQNMAKYDDMDGVDGNWYGKVIYLEFRTPQSQAYNPDEWLPDAPVL